MAYPRAAVRIWFCKAQNNTIRNTIRNQGTVHAYSLGLFSAGYRIKEKKKKKKKKKELKMKSYKKQINHPPGYKLQLLLSCIAYLTVIQ